MKYTLHKTKVLNNEEGFYFIVIKNSLLRINGCVYFHKAKDLVQAFKVNKFTLEANKIKLNSTELCHFETCAHLQDYFAEYLI